MVNGQDMEVLESVSLTRKLRTQLGGWDGLMWQSIVVVGLWEARLDSLYCGITFCTRHCIAQVGVKLEDHKSKHILGCIGVGGKF